MLALPVYVLVGIINIVAKRNNYDIHVENNPHMDIRVKRSAIEDTPLTSGKEMARDANLIDILKKKIRERRDINSNDKYNFNQLNWPYTGTNKQNNQNSANYYNNYNNGYTGNYNYNPYYNVQYNATTRNFNEDINHKNYNNYGSYSNQMYNNGIKRNYEGNNEYNNNYLAPYNTSDSTSNSDHNNNYLAPYNTSDTTSNNYYAPYNTSDSTSNNDYKDDNLNTTSTTTDIPILEGHIFSLGCPKGKKRVGFYCVKVRG